MKSSLYLAAVVAAGAIAGGCQHRPAVVTDAATDAKPKAEAAAETKIEAPAAMIQVKGKVTEVLQGGPYTYLCIENEGKKTWGTIPRKADVKVGQQVELINGMEMKNFPSKALNRTFDSIIFTDGIVVAGEKPAEVKMPGHGSNFGTGPAEIAEVSGTVVEATTAGSYSFVLVEKDGTKTWVATSPQEYKPGAKVSFQPGVIMKNFTSKSQGKTFDRIVFTAGEKSADEVEEAPQAPAPRMINLSGKVTETMDSGGYTYLCVDKDGTKTWAAVPVTKVAVGSSVELAPGMTMQNFKSSTLNRTFESIIFSGGVTVK